MTTATLRPSAPSGLAVGLGVVVLLLVAAVGVGVGPAGLPVGGVVSALVDLVPGIDVGSGLTDRQLTVLYELRLPRLVMGGMVGAILAVAGAAYQGVFRNPLADPYLLGVAAGAGLGATLSFAAGGRGVFVTVLAFAGALAAVALTYALGRTAGDRTPTTLLLAGVAVASFLTAAQTFVLQRNSETYREVYSWILGRLGTVGWGDVVTLAPYGLISIVVVVAHRRHLDVLALGDEEAAALGARVRRVRGLVVAAATLGTAVAVSVTGLIGFVGIIVPHGVRLLAGWSNRVVLPLSVIFGGALLMGADLLARTVVSPAELPIGVVTAFLGAPFFVFVLRSSRRRI